LKLSLSVRLIFLSLLLLTSLSATSASIKLSYLPEEEQGWGYVSMEISEADLKNIKNIRYVLYDEQGMKVAMAYLHLKTASHFLINPQFKGKYQLVINRLQSNGLWMDDVLELNSLMTP
jgi:hypothetical protein